MKKNYYLYYLTEAVTEGGMARNLAFSKKFAGLDFININLYRKINLLRLVLTLKVLFFLIFSRKRTVFIHQSTLLFLFPALLLKINLVRSITFKILNNVAKKNKLIIEINDLIYEQSIDLELKVDEIFNVLQHKIFTIINCNFVFASNKMKTYVVDKFGLDGNKSYVIVNGAPKLQDHPHNFNDQEWMRSSKTKFVYAGGLNKGRQIENLLNTFSENHDNLLIILGNGGKWLDKVNLPENIIYLGNYEEKIAHYLVSRCDVGIIPYDENRFYYNLCFPTKVSFYLTAGIPVLSTPLEELENVFKNEGVILFCPFSDWKNEIRGVDNLQILKMKEYTNLIKRRYEWDFLLEELVFD